MSAPEMISQGAEGKVYLSEYLGRPSIIKERVSKRYRVAELDTKLNKQRLLQEAKCMVRCRRAGVLTPSIYYVDVPHFQLHMERIMGITIKELMTASYAETGGSYSPRCMAVAKLIGESLGKMHDADIVHGDLTTSNIMVREVEVEVDATLKSTGAIVDSPQLRQEVLLIDFGLATTQTLMEDKAVDLYVLERAFLSTHPNSGDIVSPFTLGI